MSNAVYIRPLVLDDAKISYQWRNDSNIWEYTEFKPNKYISLEIEETWLKSILKNDNEKRFAICIQENNQYIGNIQLININKAEASYHIFIGEKSFWGKGIAQQATKLILEYAFFELGLEKIKLEVNPLNISANAVYIKIGFVPISKNENNGFIKMVLHKKDFISER